MFFTEVSYAALPPTTLKGQSQSTNVTTFNYQVPNNLATKISGTTSLIELNNSNTLVNPSFEHETITTGWTVNAGSTASETTEVVHGKKSLKITLSAVTGSVLTQTNTPSQKLEGLNRAAGLWVKTSLTTVQVCSMQGSTEIQCVNVPSTNLWVNVLATHVGPSSGAVGVRLKTSGSTTGDIYVDDGFEGMNPNVGTGDIANDWVDGGAITVGATTTAPAKGSTTTRDKVWYKRNGPNLDVRYEYTATGNTSATAGTGDYLFGIPTASGCTIDSSKIYFNTTLGASGQDYPATLGTATVAHPTVLAGKGVVQAYDSTNVRIFVNQTSSAGNYSPIGQTASWWTFNGSAAGYTLSAEFSVPCVGWSASMVIRADQTNFGWTDGGTNTITGTSSNPGKGTTSIDKIWYRRTNSDMEVRIEYFQTGAGTAGSGDYLFTIPSVCTIDTTKVTAYATVEGGAGAFTNKNIVGDAQAPNSTAGTIQGSVVVYDTTKVRIAGISYGAEGFVGSAFADMGIAGIGYLANFKVPCSNWTENQNAPLISGIATSSYSGVIKVEAAEINCDAASSITASTNFLSAVGNRSTTSCALTINSGNFSATPYSCNVTVKSATVNATSCSCSSATACTIYGPNADYDAYVSIIGPR